MNQYQVVTAVSSQENPRLDSQGRHILAETTQFRAARRECIEWAAYDDILVQVVKQGQVVFTCDGYSEAVDRYPRTAAAM